jgi:GNAT superfamily N-acetyltransferase
LSSKCFYHAPIKTKIREAKLTDTEIIADFNARMALETEQRQLDIARVRQGVQALLSDSAKGAYFIAETETEPAPTITGQLLITYEWSDWRNGNFWWIQSVYVIEGFRGKGIFRALFNHVDQLAKARKDVCGLRLYVDSHNDSARETYERLGMKRTNYELFETDFVLKGHE